MKWQALADIYSVKSKVNPRLLLALGIVLLLLAAFGAVQVLGGSDDAAPADDEPALDGGTGAEPSAEGSDDGDSVDDADEEPPIDGDPVVAEADDGVSGWADQANAICGQAIQDVLAQGAPAPPEQAGVVLETAQELAALEPPPGAEAEAVEFVALLKSSLDAFEEVFAMSDGGDLEDFEALTGLIEEQAVAAARLTELGAILGVETCLTGTTDGGGADIVTADALDTDAGARGMLQVAERTSRQRLGRPGRLLADLGARHARRP